MTSLKIEFVSMDFFPDPGPDSVFLSDMSEKVSFYGLLTVAYSFSRLPERPSLFTPLFQIKSFYPDSRRPSLHSSIPTLLIPTFPHSCIPPFDILTGIPSPAQFQNRLHTHSESVFLRQSCHNIHPVETLCSRG